MTPLNQEHWKGTNILIIKQKQKTGVKLKFLPEEIQLTAGQPFCPSWRVEAWLWCVPWPVDYSASSLHTYVPVERWNGATLKDWHLNQLYKTYR